MLFDWSQGNRSLDDTRERQMDVVTEHLLDRPVLGAGPKLASIRYQISEIHNTYTGVLMDTGFPGCALFMFWLLYTLRLGWRAGAACRDPYRRLLVLSLCIGMGTLMIYSMFMFGLRQRNIWILAGLLAAVPRLAGEPAAAGENAPASTHSSPALASLPRV
jgi:O-antigen ligase